MSNKVLYVGNYTIDIAIKRGVRYDGNSGSCFIRTKDGTEIEITEDLKRKITTDKNDGTEDLTFLLGKIPTAVEKFGGGGRNSLDEQIVMETTGANTMYLDIQMPVTSLERYMTHNRVEAYYLNKRKSAVNVVVCCGDEKRVIRSPIEKDKPLTAIEDKFVSAMVASSKRVVMNSIKDEALAKSIMKYCQEYHKDLGVVVTTSFDEYDFVRNEIIPNATCIFNYDEIGTVFNPEHKSLGDENEKNEDALWGIGDALTIQDKLSAQRHSIYVTLGKNGVFAADKDGAVYHVLLKNRNIKKQMSGFILRRDDATNGAGDHFAAAALKYEALGHQTISAAILGQIHAIRFIGYRGDISESDFIVQPIGKRQLQRKLITRKAA